MLLSEVDVSLTENVFVQFSMIIRFAGLVAKGFVSVFCAKSVKFLADSFCSLPQSFEYVLGFSPTNSSITEPESFFRKVFSTKFFLEIPCHYFLARVVQFLRYMIIRSVKVLPKTCIIFQLLVNAFSSHFTK